MNNKYARDAENLRAWMSASHTERVPKRAKKPEEEKKPDAEKTPDAGAKDATPPPKPPGT
jgi:hypothetical protein